MVSYHLLLLSTLLAAALIEYDGHRLPGRLFVPALLLGWLAPLAWPYVHPVSASLPIGTDSLGPVAAVVDGTVGLALGALLGLGLWRWAGANRSLGLVWGPASVGLFLGWQAGLALTLGTVFCWAAFVALRRLTPRLRPVPPTVWLAIGTLAWIVLWGQIVERWPFLG